MAKPVRPEPKFFLVDELYARGFDHYLETWFPDPDSRVAGEKSTNYLESAVAAERIHRHLPDVRLVFILREPARRAYSNWAWSRMNGLETEDFTTALSLEEDRERTLPAHLRYARPYAYFSRGLYARMLQPYFSLFPRSQVLCLKFDDLVRRPTDVASRLHRFLGVGERPDDAVGLDIVNPSEVREPIPPAIAEALRKQYEVPAHELAQLLGPEFATWDEP